MTEYVFNQTFKDEMDAFAKYLDTIHKNGFVHTIIKDINNMREPCDLFPEASGKFFKHQLNLYYGYLDDKERNPEMICASKALKLGVTKDKGRHLVVTEAIEKHKIIMTEVPTVIQVRPACLCFGKQVTGLYRCHGCSISCRLFFTCDDCNIAIFCTKDCRRKAMVYHRYECYGFQRHFWSMESTDYSYIAFRMMLYGASKKFATKGNPLRYGDENDNYPAVFQLKSHFRNLPLIKLNEILHTSARSLLYLIKRSDFFEQFDDGSIKTEGLYNYIGGLLVKHYCQAQINNVLLTFTNLYNGYGFDVPIGFGKAVCPTIALLNHSCSPNAVVMPSMNTVVVKTLRRIRKGEEVTICYSEIDSFMTLEERKLISEELFNFTCSCQLCEFETDMLEAPYKCNKCYIGLVTEILSKTDEAMGQCITCAQVMSIKQAKVALKSSQVYRSLYWTSQSVHHLKQTADFLADVFPKSSIYLSDVYNELYRKYSELRVHPVETIKYAMMVFNMMIRYRVRTNVRLLTSKVNFIMQMVESEEFNNVKRVNEEEFNILQNFLQEVMRTKKDIVFYVPADRALFYQKVLMQLETKVHNMVVIK